MFKWIQSFLRNRTIKTSLNGVTSSKRTLEEGLPQGSSLSCTLFNIFINDLAKYLEVPKALFADDLAIWITDKYPIIAKRKLNRAMLTITTYCNLWKLRLNTKKTVYSIFSRSNKKAQSKLQLKMNDEPIMKEDNPQYLGVKLDRQLSFKEHIEDLKEKVCKRLSLLKRLASTTWGADKLTLRQLYLGYVRSAMDYNLPIQTIANKNAVNSLDKVQNQALRLICGGMKTTPIAACEIEANIGPRDLRRERTLLESVERYRREETNHPNKVLIDKWKPCKRLQQESLLDRATEKEKTQHLPATRMAENKFPRPAPWETLLLPVIKISLIDTPDDVANLKEKAQQTITSYQTPAIHAYTDGSAFKGTRSAGYGIYLEYPDDTHYRHSEACGLHCSTFEAENKAIQSCIQILHQQFDLEEKQPCNTVIFSDSKAVLSALQKSPFGNPEIAATAQGISNLMESHRIGVTLQWIPGHSNTKGNDIADSLAKDGANQAQQRSACTITTAKQMLKQMEHEEWMNRWANGTTGRPMFRYITRPKTNDSINQLPRQDQARIFQFRTEHGKINYHLNRIIPTHQPKCRHCPFPYETTHHLLFYCEELETIRKDLLPPKPNVENVLYGTLDQLRRSSRFIQLALG